MLACYPAFHDPCGTSIELNERPNPLEAARNFLRHGRGQSLRPDSF